MARDLSALLEPTTTAVVTSECQNAVLGPESYLPELAAEARRSAVPNGARLVHGARAAGVQVVHAVFLRRADSRGANTNGRLFVMSNRTAPAIPPGSEGAHPLDEFGLSPDDLVSQRYHGLDPVSGTDLDSLLRNCGIRTVVIVGVSVNVALVGLTIGLVNRGYQVVVPRDAVAGVPAEYAEAMLDNTYSLIATVVSTDDVLAAWG
jgi:nicotinamidase-related amidase